MTTHWPNYALCLFLAISVVHVQNGGAYFCKIPKIDALMARNHIARELIESSVLYVKQSLA